MELREIETFLAIVEQGTFSKAAEKLGYSQSAVTVQIKQLEHELGARLFDRVPRGAALTEQGRAFAFHANEIAGAARAARASVASAQAAPQDIAGVLRLGSVESVATAILPEVLVHFHSTCPRVQVIVTTAQRDRMIEGLRNNTIDLLLTMEGHVHQSGLVTRALRREQVVFVASPALLESVDEGAPAGRPLDAASLCELPFVLTERGESYRLELGRARRWSNVCTPLFRPARTGTGKPNRSDNAAGTCGDGNPADPPYGQVDRTAHEDVYRSARVACEVSRDE